MTEADWLAGRVRTMLRYACSKATMRQRRLLACGFCRIKWSQLPDDRLKQLIELIERYADGKSGGGTLVRAYELFGVVKERAVANALHPDMVKALRAAQASNEDRQRLRAYARDMGLVFQITDDLLDVTSSAEKTGKAVGKDGDQGKATFVSIYGIARARDEAHKIASRAAAAVQPYDNIAPELSALPFFLLDRES